MAKIQRFVDLDVHQDTTVIAVAEAGRDGEVRSGGTTENPSRSKGPSRSSVWPDMRSRILAGRFIFPGQ